MPLTPFLSPLGRRSEFGEWTYGCRYFERRPVCARQEGGVRSDSHFSPPFALLTIICLPPPRHTHFLFSPVLAVHSSTRPDPEDPQDENEATQQSAMQLYGLIHARYIITTHGLDSMHTKFLNGDFGKCPRTLCKGQKVVPVRNSKVGTTLHLYI